MLIRIAKQESIAFAEHWLNGKLRWQCQVLCVSLLTKLTLRCVSQAGLSASQASQLPQIWR